ncbi:hypothetical protein [Streptomyces mangrovisoli]|uniref:Uncharacterized protein n=1 Tax=Streptomyces mangrovisoli TaxID=1428628 RepID=A0A1J4NMT5_9ACTN|nr:hypothetical protein [Streptomyces mangrovisoli]OIJ63611.1 hypothetical protein WN71_032835 [Streptomyces mangrovisoli]
MKKRQRNRAVTFLAAAALAGASSLTLGSTDAAAAGFTFEKSAVSSNGSFTIAAYYGGTYAGIMEWNADPIQGGDIPGDAFKVGDYYADGYGMGASMISPVTGRQATTRGHTSPYESAWNSGDLAEGTTVYIQLCAVKGEAFSCSLAYSGHA